MTAIKFELPAFDALTPNNEKDPLPHYYRPGLGALFAHRLQMGLDLMTSQSDLHHHKLQRVLEIGVGSGILIPTLTRHFGTYVGADLELTQNLEALVAPGCCASFQQLDLLDVPDSRTRAIGGPFHVVVAFSVLEHIAALSLAARNLKGLVADNGILILGYPMVNRLMTQAFRAIGYRGIDHDHVSSPQDIEKAFSEHFEKTDKHALPPGAPTSWALYQCSAWRRRA